MESETSSSKNLPVVIHRLLPAFVPALLISIGYVDPGRWAAFIEGGARFGFDLVALMLVFNFAAILCQYLSARIGVVTGRDLAEICSNEYDRYTCALLGIQTEFSVIASDLTMILGIAHGLNLLLGVDLFSCVFLTAMDAVFYPILATLMENYKAKFVCSFMAGSVLFAYVSGIFVSQPEISLSVNGILTKLSGESTFALMSLLGASVLPQNFYLHSALVRQQNHVEANISKETLCHDHFFATFCIFSGVFLASYMLMNSAANVFYSTGLVLLTFQDALTLVEQVFRIPIAPFLFLLVLHGSSQVTALTWSLGGEVILHDFFRLEIPSWLHRVTIRITAIIPAIYCVWNTGAEGVYQLLIFTQVMVALTLPPSLIPLFRIASSRKVMGSHKMSPLTEFLALITFIGMLGLNIIFVVEMVFGNSDWAGNLRWNFGGNSSTPYVFLLVTACVSLSLMLWLAATPLKSASAQLNTQGWSQDMHEPVQEAISMGRDMSDLGDISYICKEQENAQEIRASPEIGKLSKSHPVKLVENLDIDLPEVNQSDEERRLTTIKENKPTTSPEEPALFKQPVPGPELNLPNEIWEGTMRETKAENTKAVEPVEKTLKIEGEVQMKGDNEGYVWDAEEVPKGAPGSAPLVTSEGPGSFRSLCGKSDDGGTGAGSLSRLAGLGRAARRQLAAILDEFWGQLYDFHGYATAEAKAKKLDILLGIDPKASPMKTESTNSRSESAGSYYPSLSGRGGTNSLVGSSLYDTPEQQQRVPGSLESSQYGVQRGSASSSLWSSQMRLLDAYVQSSTRGPHLGLDSGERRYYSLRLPQASEGWDNQPATIHGYQMASYLNCMAADRKNDRFNGDFPTHNTLSPAPTSYKDSHGYALGQKLQNGLNPLQTPTYHKIGVSGVSGNDLIQAERSFYENLPASPSPNVGSPPNTKKYHSLPDISGISVYHRDKNVQWDSGIGLGLGSSPNRTAYEPSLLSSSPSRMGTSPLAFDDLSPSGKYRDALSMQLTSSSDTSSLWSRQPFEQFGVADKTLSVGGVIGNRPNSSSTTKEAVSVVESEANLLKSLRHCIRKLLKLEGADWLFKQNDGADEDLIDRVAAREKFIYEAENREMMTRVSPISEPQGSFGTLLVSSVPHCGDDCIWKSELVVSFGVWCIHRILDLSIMESRPELWGKYTYVLNRLQGIIDLAFAKPRVPMSPCFCLQIPASSFQQQSTTLTGSNGQLPPTSKPGRGKCTTAPMLLDVIKDVEIAVSSRKGRTGTAAGDVAFPKGKENLASVLKRYKRKLANKPAGGHESSGSRKIPTTSGLYGQ
ncbi:hypothetical protein CDL15_Pgr025557 [Punica granatum]|uniref:Ethylene-insensitive protein 2 n=1 Tax=Punica granatum TaxID=22663 RepID=A0A218WB70_PUNGR|nr:hypothetical protein CDL15_Pgr025557 [Punica granatum]